MTEGMNRVYLLGNLGAKPELSISSNGTAHLSFNLATNETYLDKAGTRQTVTEWHRVRLWGKRAEGLSRFLDKGMGVMVEGTLRSYSYDKDGQKHYSTEIRATDLHVLPGRRVEQSSSSPWGRSAAGLSPRDQVSSDLEPGEPDEDLRRQNQPPGSTGRLPSRQHDSQPLN